MEGHVAKAAWPFFVFCGFQSGFWITSAGNAHGPILLPLQGFDFIQLRNPRLASWAAFFRRFGAFMKLNRVD